MVTHVHALVMWFVKFNFGKTGNTSKEPDQGNVHALGIW